MQLSITPMAKEQILAAIAEEERKGLGLRVAITGKGPAGFRYSLDLVAPGENLPDDLVVEEGDFKIFVDKKSAPKLEGSTIDFVIRLQESGFKFDNPNSMWSDDRAQKVQEVIDQRINPSIASHGGSVTLLDVRDDVAYIAFGGGCQGCGMVDVTLKQGVQVMIKEAVPELKDVLDTTDHAAGTNPYYQEPSAGAESPIAD
ncbi:MAG TPA: iron-sulfur cluster assembly accessory protein [Thermoanaerobaculia bacterium]|jgi:Fe/S biogenesis protein NfuA|nr:iron-sulfur cluster assembly accessory protein [Thermoanaerobaculia bacterium]